VHAILPVVTSRDSPTEDPDCRKDPRIGQRCSQMSGNHETGRQCYDGKDNDRDGIKDW
jgi:hypothetical protein